MDDPVTRTAEAVIVTQNILEAEDLSEALVRRGLTHILHLRDANAATALLESGVLAPRVVLLGVDVTSGTGAVCLALALTSGAAVVVVNGEDATARREGALFLMRPYTSAELDALFGDAGLPRC